MDLLRGCNVLPLKYDKEQKPSEFFLLHTGKSFSHLQSQFYLEEKSKQHLGCVKDSHHALRTQLN